jgi:hypothetical protein
MDWVDQRLQQELIADLKRCRYDPQVRKLPPIPIVIEDLLRLGEFRFQTLVFTPSILVFFLERLEGSLGTSSLTLTKRLRHYQEQLYPLLDRIIGNYRDIERLEIALQTPREFTLSNYYRQQMETQLKILREREKWQQAERISAEFLQLLERIQQTDRSNRHRLITILRQHLEFYRRSEHRRVSTCGCWIPYVLHPLHQQELNQLQLPLTFDPECWLLGCQYRKAKVEFETLSNVTSRVGVGKC